MKIAAGSIVSLFLISSSWAAGATINLCVEKVEGGIKNALPNAFVDCWDEDYDWDDWMASGVTDSNGCLTMDYTKKSSASWWNPCAGWDCSPYSNPDIYCQVTKPGVIAPHHTATQNQHNQDSAANFLEEQVFAQRNCPETNGCGAYWWPTLVTDAATLLTGFANACDNHDCCYHDCDETQTTCDDAFLGEMESKCHNDHDTDTGKAFCLSIATAMYHTVQAFGSASFNKGQENC